MELVSRFIAVILIFTLLPITFAFLFAKRKSLKKYKTFKDFIEIDKAYRKLRRRNYNVEHEIEFPLLFYSSITIIFAFLAIFISLFFIVCAVGHIQLDHSLSIQNNILACIGFSLVFLLGAFYFMKRGRVIILTDQSIKTASFLGLTFKFGNFYCIDYSEVDFLKAGIMFGGGGLQSRSAECEITIESQKGNMTFLANPGYTNDVLMLIAALKEKLGDKIKIVHKSKLMD